VAGPEERVGGRDAGAQDRVDECGAQCVVKDGDAEVEVWADGDVDEFEDDEEYPRGRYREGERRCGARIGASAGCSSVLALRLEVGGGEGDGSGAAERGEPADNRERCVLAEHDRDDGGDGEGEGDGPGELLASGTAAEAEEVAGPGEAVSGREEEEREGGDAAQAAEDVQPCHRTRHTRTLRRPLSPLGAGSD
jgi:hypothetical protein